MTCPVSNKLSAQQKKKCYKKKLSYKNIWEKVYLHGFGVKILKLACFVLFEEMGKTTSKCKRWVDDKVDWNHVTEH